MRSTILLKLSDRQRMSQQQQFSVVCSAQHPFHDDAELIVVFLRLSRSQIRILTRYFVTRTTR
jgi:hypothetical protein